MKHEENDRWSVGLYFKEVETLVSKVERNKRKKESSLYAAAYDLFTTKGINNTAINDIVKQAGVGKGTFYLYFEDKYDILDKIIMAKSIKVLTEAMNETKLQKLENFEEEILYFIDYIINFLKENRLMLKLIHKNLSWGVLRKASEDYTEVKEIYEMFKEGYKDTSMSKSEIEKILFMIVDLTGSVAYSAIILKEPASMDEMKPMLFSIIRKIV